MFKKFIAIYILLLTFYFASESFYLPSERKALLNFIIISGVLGLFIGPSISSKNKKREEKEEGVEIIDKEFRAGDYHNDFRRVGSAEDYKNKPPQE